MPNRIPILLVLAAITAAALQAQTVKAFASVFDEKTGQAITGLKPSNFSVVDGEIQMQVLKADYQQDILDAMLLIDSSLVGESVRPLAGAMIDGVTDKDQMALVSYHESADLLQDFTSSKELLLRALQDINYRNNPRALDALYAAIDGGFVSSAGKRVVLLLSSGVEGFSRVPEAEIFRLARSKKVTIYPIFVMGAERRLFRNLADHTGGAYFEAQKLKLKPKELSELVYTVVRSHYELEMSGVFSLGLLPKIEIVGLPKSKQKIRATLRPFE